MDLLDVYDDSGDESSRDGHNDDETLRENTRIDGAVPRSQPRRDSTGPGVVDIVSSERDAAFKESHQFVRSVPHVRGNWAGHVFVQLVDRTTAKVHTDVSDDGQQDEWHERARQSTHRFREELRRAGWSGSIVTQFPYNPSSGTDLHLSLSRPFFMQLASIPSFRQRLQQRLSQERSATLTVCTRPEQVLVNEEATRSFWCWPVTSSSCLQRLVSHVDTVLASYNQPAYYNPPDFHVSVASIPGDMRGVLSAKRQTDKEEESSDDDDIDEEYPSSIVHINHVYCSFGTTKLYRIDLLA